MENVVITNGQIITPDSIIPKGSVVLKGNTIVSVHEGNVEISNARVINAEGHYVSPGFIDIHVHGGGGFDFMDGSVESFLKIAQLHARYGTTAMVPTTLTSEKESLLDILEVYKEATNRNMMGAEFLGIHLEGPYFSMNQRGSQDAKYIRDPDPKEYTEILKRSDRIVRWSVAPERKGALELGQFLKEKGVLAAIAILMLFMKR